MQNWRNSSGRPLSSVEWLEIHHRAKLPERTAFVKKILERRPKTIVDLGCGPGLWLGLIDQYAAADCELVGIDSDRSTLSIARAVSRGWDRTVAFMEIDIVGDADAIPEADVFLAFNIFPYLQNSEALLAVLRSKLRPNGTVIVRQYDGSLLRLGPQAQRERSIIDDSLQASVLGSHQFRHYDMDRVFELARVSGFDQVEVDFEMYRRFAPFDAATLGYIRGTIEWEKSLVSDVASSLLETWLKSYVDGRLRDDAYVVTIDLVAFLSVP
jgi:SAM-dependent methyltransferase